MLIDVHACCLVQSIGEACHVEEQKPAKKKGQKESNEEIPPPEPETPGLNATFVKEFN
jgi:hypothetical protein